MQGLGVSSNIFSAEDMKLLERGGYTVSDSSQSSINHCKASSLSDEGISSVSWSDIKKGFSIECFLNAFLQYYTHPKSQQLRQAKRIPKREFANWRTESLG
jgi:hypothetical protein